MTINPKISNGICERCKSQFSYTFFTKRKRFCSNCKSENDKVHELDWKTHNRKRTHKYYIDCHKRHKNSAFIKLGDKCANPSCQWVNEDGTKRCTDRRCLQIDHVNGNGNKERKAGNLGHKLFNDVLKDITGKYQLLCANCNWIKRYEKDEVAVHRIRENH